MAPLLSKLLLTLLAGLPYTLAASLQKLNVTLDANPTNVGFHIYVPDKLASKPAILVNPHWCHGDAPAAFRAGNSAYATLADKHGFIVIYPDSPNAADKCWDVSSRETLTHEGGGDSLGIVSMVRWALKEYDGDKERVFVTGVSSGAMMTSVLIGAYPDVFAAGSAFSGVPFGCFEPEGDSRGKYGYWNDACAKGELIQNGTLWGDLVRRAWPGYDGWRPKMQIWHGTVDEILNYTLHGEQVKQWADVFGYNEIPTLMVADTPRANWTKYVYGPDDWLEAYSAQGVPHNIPVQFASAAAWFGLECDPNEEDVTGEKKCFRWGQRGPGKGYLQTEGRA